MILRLHEMEHSPYCIPIAEALRALSVAFERVPVPNWDRRSLLELTEGKYYQVPVLEHNGKVIYESSSTSVDIAEYVDEVFGGERLFPRYANGLQRILIDHIEGDLELATFKLNDPWYMDTIENLIDKALIIRHKERRFGMGCLEEWRRDHDALRANADRLLSRFEDMLERSPFLLGSSPLYVDFALLGIIGNMTYGGVVKLSDRQDNLKSWTRRMLDFSY